jgi:hypothetical protein
MWGDLFYIIHTYVVMNTAITAFGASDMVLPIPHCIDLIVNKERHVMSASQECFVV